MILEFFFDLASPYAYLGLVRMLRLSQDHPDGVCWHPVDTEAIKRAAGNVGPALRDLPAKLRYVAQDAGRWAQRDRVPMATFMPRPAPRLNRGTFLAIERGQAPLYLACAARRVWGEGADPESEGVLRAVADELRWDEAPFLAYTLSPQARALQDGAQAHARRHGVFGVPTLLWGERLLWGNDRIAALEPQLRAALAAKEPTHG